MSGQGKYTTYAPAATPRKVVLNRLFKGNSAVANPFADLVGKEDEARLQTIARAKLLLKPEVQQGDLGHFPSGVNMHYAGDQNGVEAPDVTKVEWTRAGDAANGYMPDPTSPGPGFTDPSAKDTDPNIEVADIKGAGYVPGAPGTGTKSPSVTTPAIVENSTLGEQGKLAYDVNGFG